MNTKRLIAELHKEKARVQKRTVDEIKRIDKMIRILSTGVAFALGAGYEMVEKNRNQTKLGKAGMAKRKSRKTSKRSHKR